MRGHVRKRGRSWCFVIDVGRDPETRKRRQRWQSGFPTRKAAEKALRSALGRLDLGGDPIPTNTTVNEFVRRWLAHLEAIDSPRPNSRRRYAELLHERVVPLIGGMRLELIRPAHVQAVLDAATEAGLSPATVQKVRAAVSSMFNTAVKVVARRLESGEGDQHTDRTFTKTDNAHRISATWSRGGCDRYDLGDPGPLGDNDWRTARRDPGPAVVPYRSFSGSRAH